MLAEICISLEKTSKERLFKLNSLKETQARTLEEKSRKWGFDFKQLAPVSTGPSSGGPSNGSPIRWKPVF